MQKTAEIFGHPISIFQKTCVIAPFLFAGMLKDLEILDFKRGFPFSSGSSEHLTLIVTGMGATLAGDAVLLLKDSPCQNIVLTGSCGAVCETEVIQLGAVVQIAALYHLESFSEMLSAAATPRLVANNLPVRFKDALPSVGCSVGSMFMEHCYLSAFKQFGIQVVDLEASAVFSASQWIGIPASALLYVSDVIHASTHPFISGRTDSTGIHNAQKTILNSLKGLF